MPLPVMLERGTQVSRYRIEDLVARGGMGLVYRATDIQLERHVALKVLTPELSGDENFRGRFVRESRLAAAVDHPHIIPVYEAGDWDGLLYLAMRFVHGVDLHSVLATVGALPTETSVALLRQAADALDAAHDAGLVHRDVKPGNFLLAGARADEVPLTTHVYLTDFGLTKRASSVSGLTRTGQFLGSMHYVAPEQIRGEDVDARADVYALACVAFEMFAGRPPFEREQDAALLWAHMWDAPPRVTDLRSDLPHELADVLAAGMAKDRDQRPPTCGELVHKVRSAVDGPTVAGHAPGDPGVRVATTPQAPATWYQPVSAPPVSVPPAASGYGSVPPPRPAAEPSFGPGYGAVPSAGGALSAPAQPPRSSRLRRRWWLLTAAVVVALVAGLLVWRPWSSGLVTRDLAVVPYSADVPSGWQASTRTGDIPYVTLGTRDWTGFVNSEDSAVNDASNAAKNDPESLVFLYVDGSERVTASTSQEAADQVEASLPSGAVIVGQGDRQVGGRAAFTVGGVFPLGSDQQLRLYGVAIKSDPRALLLFICPPSVYDEWKPTFDRTIDSVTYTG